MQVLKQPVTRKQLSEGCRAHDFDEERHSPSQEQGLTWLRSWPPPCPTRTGLLCRKTLC
jgi:hypothetical protein